MFIGRSFLRGSSQANRSDYFTLTLPLHRCSRRTLKQYQRILKQYQEGLNRRIDVLQRDVIDLQKQFQVVQHAGVDGSSPIGDLKDFEQRAQQLAEKSSKSAKQLMWLNARNYHLLEKIQIIIR